MSAGAGTGIRTVTLRTRTFMTYSIWRSVVQKIIFLLMSVILLGSSLTAYAKITDSWTFAVLLSGEGIEGTHLLIKRKNLSIEQCMFMLGGYTYQTKTSGAEKVLPLMPDENGTWSVMMRGTYEGDKEVLAVILCQDEAIQT